MIFCILRNSPVNFSFLFWWKFDLTIFVVKLMRLSVPLIEASLIDARNIQFRLPAIPTDATNDEVRRTERKTFTSGAWKSIAWSGPLIFSARKLAAHLPFPLRKLAIKRFPVDRECACRRTSMLKSRRNKTKREEGDKMNAASEIEKDKKKEKKRI